MISVDEARRLALSGENGGAGPAAPRLVVIGCGSLLRGDDAVGPILIRHLWDTGAIPDFEEFCACLVEGFDEVLALAD